MIRYQRTVKASVGCGGIGLHTGRTVRMQLKPAPAGTGIIFLRTDLGNAPIKAIAANTAATSYATTLSQKGVAIQTVEHLLAALAGLQIDNAYIEVNADEIPIMDGSAQPFVDLIARGGIQTQEELLPALKVVKPIFVREGSRQLAIWPAETTNISCFIDYNHPLLKEQSMQYQPSQEAFLREVMHARTFGFMSDLEALQARGLAQGASLENAIGLSEDSVLNPEGLRCNDEFVRHKLLDLIGDLSLAGMPIIGHIVAHKSGHGLNAQFVRKILNSPQSWIMMSSRAPEPARQETKFAFSLQAGACAYV